MKLLEVARFEGAGDVRRVLTGVDGERFVVREELSGPSARIAYGEGNHSLTVTFEADAVSDLIARVGVAQGEESLWEHLAGRWHDVVDLMDLCDREGVPYALKEGACEPTRPRPVGWGGC